MKIEDDIYVRELKTKKNLETIKNKDFIEKLIEKLNHRNLLNKIFDNFESKICNNCKHLQGNEYYLYGCDILLSHTKQQAEKLIRSGFGCNRFERKETK